MRWRRQLCSGRDRDERDRAFPQRETPLGGAGFLLETTEGLRGLGRAVYSSPECLFSPSSPARVNACFEEWITLAPCRSSISAFGHRETEVSNAARATGRGALFPDHLLAREDEAPKTWQCRAPRVVPVKATPHAMHHGLLQSSRAAGPVAATLQSEVWNDTGL